MSKIILLIEDDKKIRSANKLVLELEGYEVFAAETLLKGKQLNEQYSPDLIVLDILLPDGNGLEYCKEIRGVSGVRILFLSALDAKSDTIAGLKAGGDDYLVKPYIVEEFLLRVQSLLRRSSADIEQKTVGITIDKILRHAYYQDKNLMLTPKELSLLLLLLNCNDDYLSPVKIAVHLWGDASIKPDIVHNAIYCLRGKLSISPFKINLKRGRGYKLVSN